MQSPSTERYEIIEELGRGGMGAVFLARDRLLRREVALKVITSATNEDVAAERFVKEARATAALSHPTLIPTYTISRVGEDLFFTMEVVRGQTLRDVMSDSKVTLHRLVRALIDLSRGVDYAHRHGVVHRDIKPDNVMIDPQGRVAILDWGLVGARATGDSPDLLALAPGASRLTVTGSLMGTPGYMAPEQATGDPDEIGPLSDIYALGAILYEVLTKTISRDGSMYEVLIELQERVPIELPSHRSGGEIPPELEAICMKAMAMSPGDRYASAAELADDLDAWSSGRNVSVLVPPWPVRGSRWIASHRLASAAVAMCLVLGALLFGLWDTRRRLDDAAEQLHAQQERERLHRRLDADQSVAVAAFVKAQTAFGELTRAHVEWRKARAAEDQALSEIPDLPTMRVGESMVDFERRLNEVCAAPDWNRVRRAIGIRTDGEAPPGSSTALRQRIDSALDRWFFDYDQSRRFYGRVKGESAGTGWSPRVEPVPDLGLIKLAAMRLEIELDRAMAHEADHPTSRPGGGRSMRGLGPEQVPLAWRGTVEALGQFEGLPVDRVPTAKALVERVRGLLEGRTDVRIASPPRGWSGQLLQLTGGELWAVERGGELVTDPMAGMKLVRDIPSGPLDATLLPGEYVVRLSRGEDVVRIPFLVSRGVSLEVSLDLPERIPAGMAYIPAGSFMAGGDGFQALPRHRARVYQPFLIQLREVSLDDYRKFLNHLNRTDDKEMVKTCAPRVGAGEGYVYILVTNEKREFVLAKEITWLRWDHPAFGMGYLAAAAYARWKTQQRTDGWVWRLPTSREWSLAAGGPVGRRYPWGSKYAIQRLRCSESRGKGYSSPVDLFPMGRSIYGLYNMSGNVWEYVATPFSKQWITQLGGSFGGDFVKTTVASRDGNHPQHVGADDGFRLVLAPPRSGR